MLDHIREIMYILKYVRKAKDILLFKYINVAI